MTQEVSSSVTPAEWRRVALWSAVVLVLINLPLAAGYLLADDGHSFVGAVHNVSDAMTYLAKMQQGYAGSWTYRLAFTTEPHPGIPFLYLPYLLLGHIARWTGVSLPLLYHMTRLACGAFLLWVTYHFIAFILPDANWRWTAFLLVTIASGFGVWVALIAGSFAPPGIFLIDLWPMGYFTFAVLLSSPHHMLGLALVFVVVQSVVTYWETASPRSLLVATVAALGQGFLLPFMSLVYGSVLALAWLLERRWRVDALRTAGAAIWVGLAPAPIVLYLWICMQQHPVWLSFTNQNLTLSPKIWDYWLGYGLVGVLALPGIWWAWHSGARGRLAVTMVAVSLALAYLPVNFQRRLAIGAHVPMCALAAAGIHGCLVPLWQRWRPTSQTELARREGLTRAFIVGLSAIGSIYVLASMLVSCVTYSPHFYISAETMAGIRWLAKETPSDAAVFSAYSTGGIIPAYAGRRTFWGHIYETPFEAQTRVTGDRFFSETASNVERQTMLRRSGITYVFYGPDEQALGAFDPQSAPYLVPVFRNNSVTIYEVD